MKCPKCNYITFDYRDRCPHCNKDLSRERKRIDLVAFKHDPPFLLGSLTGDSGDIEPSLEAPRSGVDTRGKEEDLDMYLDSEDLSESLSEEEFSLDLEDESIGFEDNALASFGSGDILLDETTPELPPGHRGALSDSAEIATTEMDRKKLGIPQGQGNDTGEPEDESL
jgi:hypothetical protein